ncbi:MAG: hypothetical protein QNJ38_01425 [Prochloraceae cyanobacterium]|nr:hypothetical protein [Prochloraceae cyanobacterium]
MAMAQQDNAPESTSAAKIDLTTITPQQLEALTKNMADNKSSSPTQKEEKQAQQVQNPETVLDLYTSYKNENTSLKSKIKELEQQIQSTNNNGNNGNNLDLEKLTNLLTQDQSQQRETLEQQIQQLQKQKTSLKLEDHARKQEWDKITEIHLNQQKEDYNKQIESLSSQLEQFKQQNQSLNTQLSSSLEEIDRNNRKQAALSKFIAEGGDPSHFEYLWRVDLEPYTKFDEKGQLKLFNPVTKTFVTDESGKNYLGVENKIQEFKQGSQALFFSPIYRSSGIGTNNQGFNTQSTDFTNFKVSKRIWTDTNYFNQVKQQIKMDPLEAIQKGLIQVDTQS